MGPWINVVRNQQVRRSAIRSFLFSSGTQLPAQCSKRVNATTDFGPAVRVI
jgi:hypothetical protein